MYIRYIKIEMNNRTWIKDLKLKIRNYDVITFDIFDTLIKRDCSSFRNIFEVVEEKCNCNFENIQNFAELRYFAEVDLYKNKDKKVPTLKNIYDNIEIQPALREVLMDLECKTEIEFACVNEEVYKIYLECRNLGKKIYAISDMYLSKDTLMKMLNKCGYYIDEIWISCENNANKSSGELFKKFILETGINPCEILHIGDNRVADIKGAKKCAIDAFEIPHIIENTTYYKKKNNKKSWENDYLYPFVNNHIAQLNSRIQKIGFETLGPMIYGFCQWLHWMKKEYKIDKLLFCARDVYQTMKIYEMMYPEECDEIEYLCVSLKSLKKPYEAAIGVDTSEDALLQLKLIKEYLIQLGCKGNKIAMVDSGCGGHTQHMLETILGDTCDFHGLYMRISKNFSKNVQDKESFPYMFKDKPSAKSYISGAFFETMLSATHGRTLGYYFNNEEGIVKPVFGEDNPKADILNEFQEGILCFVKEWNQLGRKEKLISSEMIQDAFLNLAFFPLEEDVDLLSGITGGNESYMDIVLGKNDKQNFFEDLRDTYWKGGYMCKKFKNYKWLCKIYLFIDEKILNLTGF